jgi:2-polyprenyl-3-methyl-5-hydroxy-6-metoxy-1,4-benzoquinol methylase
LSASKQEVETLLREHDFRYQRVALPHGLATPGHDRSETAALVLPDRLDGKSFLDVGCAQGYFCFEAERRGADRVVGIERKDETFQHANLLKGVLGSRAEFLQSELPQVALQEQFDLVICLNVIHHVVTPVAALQALSELARERLVLEFPTFADRTFRARAGIRFWRLYERKPVIGVSPPDSGKKYVFTREAIRRILLDRCGIRDVEFAAAPGSRRTIAFCTKPS